MHSDELVTVYTVTDAIGAELIKNRLAIEGIECVLSGIHQASAAGLPGTNIQIQVPSALAKQARAALRSMEESARSD